MQITRGDYLKDLITIYLENNTDKELSEVYEKLILQCGDIQKEYAPIVPIDVSFTEGESLLLKNNNTCYLAGITKDGHKETFAGSLSFNTRGEVVFYEPTSTVTPTTSTASTTCGCQGVRGYFSTCSRPEIKAYFVMNWKPEKLSQLLNDTDFQDGAQVAESISIHNASTEAHPYIQSALASATEALTVSIQAETTARIDAVSLAISTTEAYTDSVVTQATEATKAYADSIISTATTATEAYTDSVLQSATTAINTTIGDLSQLDTSVKSSVVNAINSEVSARQGADNNLQNQIDGLAAASDVTDIVGTYAELQAYDTQHLNNNDIIKVLSDETHDDEPSYYRFNKTAGTFSYIGSESAAYTKAQSNSIFVTQTTEINGHALSSNINLIPSDIGALADSYATVISANTSAIAANTSAIAANTTVIVQHTTAIATNTSAISTINGKIPTDASSSNKLVSASTLSASIADFANQDLLNLTSNGEARLHALKSYADEGELLTDPDGLAFVEKYAHSTYCGDQPSDASPLDPKKFIKVGSPIVTTDGIVSGFSLSNYMTKTLDFSGAHTWEIQIPFTTTDDITTEQRLIDRTAGINSNLVIVKVDNSFCQIATNVDGINIFLFDNTYFSVTANTSYIVSIGFDGAKYYVKYNVNNTETTVKTYPSTSNAWNSATLHTIGRGSNTQYFKGSIDLKQFSITVDGVEVFLGNKTGIDTIKPSDYQVVGAPTISEDGIASGFSNTNYLKFSPIQLGNYNSWTIISPEFTSNDLTSGQFIFKMTYGDYYGGVRLSIGSSKLTIEIASDTTHDANIARFNTLTVLANTKYQVKISFTGTEYIAWYKVGDDEWQEYNRITSSTKIYNALTQFYIGYSHGDTQTWLLGSIDLNSFKIYVDGNLVYQPCLKIPYTESKTGSKIVSSPYRERVNDMADQFGYANYYTLDEDNGNFTLPQVELYGLIGSQTLRNTKQSGISKNYLYSDRMQIQTGSCTSGTEVTLPVPFADANYALTVPYSAKTATAFTPTQTGDWIAIGLGVL